MLNRGDEVSVRVVEVDRERGRIGLRLTEDPEVAGKSVEELAGVGSGGGGGRAGGGRASRDGGRGTGVSSNGRDRSERPRRRDGADRGPGGERGSGRPRHGREHD